MIFDISLILALLCALCGSSGWAAFWIIVHSFH